jgi:hypothetical protein
MWSIVRSGSQCWHIAAGIWLVIISILTVFKCAPQSLNADIIINSVMALQRLTLYYWGQNRLINVLPLLASAFRNPTVNLYVVLFVPTLSFYALLYLIARCASYFAPSEQRGYLSSIVFFVLTAGFVLVFKDSAIAEIAIWHIEYTLAAVLFVLVVDQLILQTKQRCWRTFWAFVAMVIAMGLNPSTILPALLIVVLASIYKKKLKGGELGLLVCAILAFLFWHVLSIQYGGQRYNIFNVAELWAGLTAVFIKLGDAVRIPYLIGFVLVMVCCVGWACCLHARNRVRITPLFIYVNVCACLFVVGWFLLFSTHKWVKMNNYDWRYFTYALFVMLLIGALWTTQCLRLVRQKGLYGIACLAILSSVVASFAFPLPLLKHTIFAQVNALTKPGSALYVGNYWLVWPSVMRDVMAGYEAYGMSERGEANLAAVTAYLEKKLQQDGQVTVYCLDAPVADCVARVHKFAADLQLQHTASVANGAVQLAFVK